MPACSARSSAASSTSASCAGARSPSSRWCGRRRAAPSAAAAFGWYENVPIVSWLALRGRCRGCGEPISVQYPLIELATALIWAFMVWRHGFGLEALRGAVFGTILLGIAMTDARAYIIPDEFSLGGLGPRACCSPWARACRRFGTALLGAAVGFGLLWLVAVAGQWVLQAGGDGRRRHQDDGDGRRLRRLAGDPAHDLSRGAPREPHLRAAVARGATRSWCRSASSSRSARRRPTCVGPASWRGTAAT